MHESTATAAKSTQPKRITNTKKRVLDLIDGARSDFPGAARRMGFRRLARLAEAIVRSTDS